MGDDNRGRGILTKKDREYLADPESYREHTSRQAVYERQNGIRQRVIDGVLDFTQLLEDLPAGERREIFGGQFGHLSPDEVEELLNPDRDETAVVEAIQNAIAFLYLAAADRPENHHDMVEEGVRRGEERRTGERTSAEVTLDVETYSLRQVAVTAEGKMKKGVELTDTDIRALLETGRVPPDEVAEYLRQDSDDVDEE